MSSVKLQSNSPQSNSAQSKGRQPVAAKKPIAIDLSNLGHPDYRVRETASRRLSRNPSAVPGLIEKVLRTGDPEQKWRARGLLYGIYRSQIGIGEFKGVVGDPVTERLNGKFAAFDKHISTLQKANRVISKGGKLSPELSKEVAKAKLGIAGLFASTKPLKEVIEKTKALDKRLAAAGLPVDHAEKFGGGLEPSAGAQFRAFYGNLLKHNNSAELKQFEQVVRAAELIRGKKIAPKDLERSPDTPTETEMFASVLLYMHSLRMAKGGQSPSIAQGLPHAEAALARGVKEGNSALIRKAIEMFQLYVELDSCSRELHGWKKAEGKKIERLMESTARAIDGGDLDKARAHMSKLHKYTPSDPFDEVIP